MACLVGGILVAIISVLFGDWLGAALDGALDLLSFESFPALQPTTIVGGITVFGGAGLMFERYTGLATAVIIILSLLIAVAASTAVFFLYVKPMKQSENSIAYSMTELPGKLGEVLVSIPSTGYGEVMLRAGAAGVTNQIAASFDGEPIAEGAQVVVVEVKEGTLYVAEVSLP